jgi:hypothetical protein
MSIMNLAHAFGKKTFPVAVGFGIMPIHAVVRGDVTLMDQEERFDQKRPLHAYAKHEYNRNAKCRAEKRHGNGDDHYQPLLPQCPRAGSVSGSLIWKIHCRTSELIDASGTIRAT